MSADWATTKGSHKKAQRMRRSLAFKTIHKLHFSFQTFTPKWVVSKRSIPCGSTSHIPSVQCYGRQLGRTNRGAQYFRGKYSFVQNSCRMPDRQLSPFRAKRQSLSWRTLRCKPSENMHPADVSVSDSLACSRRTVKKNYNFAFFVKKKKIQQHPNKDTSTVSSRLAMSYSWGEQMISNLDILLLEWLHLTDHLGYSTDIHSGSGSILLSFSQCWR